MNIVSMLGITFWDFTAVIGWVLIIGAIILLFFKKPKLVSIIQLWMFIVGAGLAFFSPKIEWVLREPIRILFTSLGIIILTVFYFLIIKRKNG